MTGVTYQELLERFGEYGTRAILENLERLTGIRDANDKLDEESRFRQVIDAMNKTEMIH